MRSEREGGESDQETENVCVCEMHQILMKLLTATAPKKKKEKIKNLF
jgi:hypothetical protein